MHGGNHPNNSATSSQYLRLMRPTLMCSHDGPGYTVALWATLLPPKHESHYDRWGKATGNISLESLVVWDAWHLMNVSRHSGCKTAVRYGLSASLA